MFRRLVLAGLAVVAAVPALAAAPSGSASTVTIRIHNYAGVTARQLEAAQEQVSDTYARIGVTTEWLPSLQPQPAKGPLGAFTPDPEEASVVLMLITTPMAARMRIPPDIAGYAATNGRAVGRVAFIVADCVDRIAWRGRLGQPLVLGGVIAHELAHLLMPGRPHSKAGIMRPKWTTRDFASFDRQRFADEEVAVIRHSVAGLARQYTARVAD